MKWCKHIFNKSCLPFYKLKSLFYNQIQLKSHNYIPEGAIWQKETLRRITPPEGFTAVAGWLQAATLSKNQRGESSLIVIDYINLIESELNSKERSVYSNHYDLNTPSSLICEPNYFEGGLYTRSPKWFANDDHTPIYNAEIRDAFLCLDASKTPDKILHWWTSRVDCNPDARYFLEIRVKIEGKVGLQLGSDYWVDKHRSWNGYDENCESVNNCEAWISNWYGDTNGRFITIRAPRI